jgi:uroporphyrinogen III methyltransferase/synthase
VSDQPTGELRGKRILVTRAAAQASGLAGPLRAAGADVLEVPLLTFQPVGRGAAARRALAALDSYDLLLFTSANAVRAFAEVASSQGVALRAAGGPRVVAIGPATAAATRAAGMGPAELPPRFTAEALGEALAGGVAGKRVLLPRAQVAGEELPRRLRRAGALVEVLPLYRTVPDPAAVAAITRLLGSGLDMVTFASASAVGAFVAAAGVGFRRPTGLRVACIGPVTAAAARDAGLEPDIVADEHTSAGLAEAIRADVRPGAAREHEVA